MIRKYTEQDFETLSSWVTDPDLLFLFSGPDWKYPLTPEQLSEYQKAKPDRHLYMGFKDDLPYAFGEIITREANAPRLGRILIGETSMRGKGLGPTFIGELIGESVKYEYSDSIHLFVLENNLPAIRCYEKMGFSFNNDVTFTLRHNETDLKVFKMTLKLKP